MLYSRHYRIEYNIMDNDELLYQNKFISDPTINAGYGMTEDLRQHKLKSKQEQRLLSVPQDSYLLDHDTLKTNKVITETGEAKPLLNRGLIKEHRTVLNINSNQRNFFTESELTAADEFINCIVADSYTEFAELYQLAIDLGSSRSVRTYQDYAEENNLTVSVIGSDEARCREIVRNIISENTISSKAISVSSVLLINDSLIDLITSVSLTNTGMADFESMASRLNAFVMSGAAYNPNNFWRPFYFTGNTGENDTKIKKIVYDKQYPNDYTITLHNVINHVKSIRLLSTEIPNTVNNITERNNIITLTIRKKAVTGINNDLPVPLSLDTTKTIFNFILIKLEIGNYTMESLITHMETIINATVKDLTVKNYGKLFIITWNRNNGHVKITCQRPELEFHLKFYSQLSDVSDIPDPGVIGASLGKTPGTVKNYSHDLWYMLGFPWPYEISNDADDRYTTELTNLVNFGIHTVLNEDSINNDIFDRDQVENSASLSAIYATNINLSSTAHNVMNNYRPYQYPSLGNSYIYLVLKGLKAINHIHQFNNVTSFNDNDIFAKIQLNVAVGEISYNTYVDNPLIFLNSLDKLDSLNIEWVDDRGIAVDFNKVDHSFTLEIIHYVTQLDVNEFDTGLGTIDKESYPEYLSGKKR
uniref:DUF5901 domain-containing protein n=1 Tax=viral metagenome TaxID=1070528 RepID=A0A6C0J3Y1_9ZZZZ